MRRAGRTDANQQLVVETLRKAGVFVTSLAGCGDGVPDLVAITPDRVKFLEVKDSAKPASKRKLTPQQVIWHAKAGRHVAVVTTPLEALEAVLGVNVPRLTDEQVREALTDGARQLEGADRVEARCDCGDLDGHKPKCSG